MCVCVCVGGGAVGVTGARFNSSIQAFTFQMLIAVSSSSLSSPCLFFSPCPPRALFLRPAPAPAPPPQPRLHTKNGPPPLEPSLMPFIIQNPFPLKKFPPLRLDLKATSTCLFFLRGSSPPVSLQVLREVCGSWVKWVGW